MILLQPYGLVAAPIGVDSSRGSVAGSGSPYTVADELKTNVFTSAPRQRLEKGEGAPDVVVVIEEGLLDRLTHRLQRGEVNAGVESRLEDLLHGIQVADIGFHELGLMTGDPPDPGDYRTLRVHEVVDDHRLVARLDQRDHGVTADEPGSACYEYAHSVIVGGPGHQAEGSDRTNSDHPSSCR